MILQLSLAACASAGMAWAVRGKSSSVFGASIWRGPRDRRAVALTFDDGPSESTAELLEILAAFGARATFFQVGSNVRRLPEAARAVAAASHEIGNHSDTHPMFCFRSASFMRDQVARAQEAIAAATGVHPRLFRAPYGVRWPGLDGVQREAGLTGVMWTAIGLDWKRNGRQVAARLLQTASNGAILCLHDGRGTQARPGIGSTLEAVRRIVPDLLGRGYALMTVSDLCRMS